MLSTLMSSNPNFEPHLPRDCASSTCDRRSAVHSRSVFSSGLIMPRIKFLVVCLKTNHLVFDCENLLCYSTENPCHQDMLLQREQFLNVVYYQQLSIACYQVFMLKRLLSFILIIMSSAFKTCKQKLDCKNLEVKQLSIG